MARIVFTLEDGTEIETELDSDVITLGRHPDSHVVLPSISVSSHHATLKRRGEDYYIQDLGATNGTRLNGVEIEEAKLSNGDQITLGDVPGVVYLSNAPAPRPASRSALPPPVVVPKAVVGPARPANRPAPAPGRAPAQAQYAQYKDGIGCASFFMLIVFLALSFIVGLCVRHYSITNGGFLPTDLIKKWQQGDNPPADVKPAPAPAPAP